MSRYVIKDFKHKVFSIKRTEKSAKAEVSRLFNKYKKALKYDIEHEPRWHKSDHFARRLTSIGQFRTAIQYHNTNFTIEHNPYWLCWSHCWTPLYLGKDTTLENFDKIILKLYNNFVKENPISNPFRYEKLKEETPEQRKERYKKNRRQKQWNKKWNAMTEPQQIQYAKDAFCEDYDKKYLTEYPSISDLMKQREINYNKDETQKIKWKDLPKERLATIKRDCQEKVDEIKEEQQLLTIEIEEIKDNNIRKLNLSESEEIALAIKEYETFSAKTPIEPDRTKESLQSKIWHIGEYHRIKQWKESLPLAHKDYWNYAWNKHIIPHIPFEEQEENLKGFKQNITNEWYDQWLKEYVSGKPIAQSRLDLIKKLEQEKKEITNE